MRNESNVPSSPDALASGIHGRVQGVTRIGPRAMMLGFLVIVALLVGILFGMLRTPKSQAQQAAAVTAPIVAPPQPSTAPHFGENVPIVESPAPDTPPPAIVLPPTPPPNSDVASRSAEMRTSPAGPGPEQLALERRIDAEQRRLAAEDAARADALQRANQAPIFTGGTAGSTQSAPQAAASAAPMLASATTPAIGVGAAHGNTLPASRYAPATSFELTAGSVVPAALVTGIDSEQPGLIIGQVREDVYDAKSGRYLLIPRGTRLIGSYKSDVAYGKSRVLVAWQRLIFPDTTSIDLLNMTGADVQGGGGLGGTVDNHTGQLVGATLLSSVLAAGVALSQPRTQTVATTAGGTVAIPSAGQVAAQGVGQQLADVGQTLIAKNLAIPPVVHVPKGYPFVVVVDRDMVFAAPYEQGS